MKEYRVAEEYGGKWENPFKFTFGDFQTADRAMVQLVLRGHDAAYRVEQRDVTEWEPVND